MSAETKKKTVLNKETFIKVKDFHMEGGSASEISKDIDLPVSVVQKIIITKDWDTYVDKNLKSVAPEENYRMVTSAASGYFNGLIAEKYEQNTSLGETQTVLANNVKQLWAVTRLLEQRKSDLEHGIAQMEKFLKRSLTLIDVDDVANES